MNASSPPPCHQWGEAAVIELGWVIDGGDFPALEHAIGRQELHCEALEEYR